MKVVALLLAFVIAGVQSEHCSVATDCTLEDCGMDKPTCVGATNGQQGTCTCGQAGGNMGPNVDGTDVETGGSCSEDTNCNSDNQLHCPHDARYCHDSKCACHPPGGHHGGMHGGFGKK